MVGLYITKMFDGDELLDQGIEQDAYKQPIVPGTEYRVRIYKYRKTMTILSVKDWDIKLMYDTFKEIEQQGAISWFNFGCRLGFLENPSDCLKRFKEMELQFADDEHFEKAQKMKDWAEELVKYEEEEVNEN